MSFQAFSYGVNIIAFSKLGQKFAMACSWATQVDDDKIVMLIGSQSSTGANIDKNNLIGVSALGEGQEEIAKQLGSKHSNKCDKLIGISYYHKEDAIIIKGAVRALVVKVIDIIHLKGIESDHLIYGQIVSQEEFEGEFLTLAML